MMPIVDRLRTDYEAEVLVLSLDANGAGRAAFQAGGLPGHPAYVILLPNGREIWRGFGVVQRADFDAALRKALDALD